MADNIQSGKKNLTPDWFVQGILTKIGDLFDRLLGRGWKPSSSLATSELIERLKALLDAEAREIASHTKFVPHYIKLKMQWDKFSVDADDALRRLENELLTATVDHINDRRYYTYAPVSLEVKPDYFTTGVTLFVSFDDGGESEREAQIHLPAGSGDAAGVEDKAPVPVAQPVIARFTIAGEQKEKRLNLAPGKRISVGRTRENDLALGDISVSKIHASLVVNGEGSLVVADTGSTNGTFINVERIRYGKARVVMPGDILKFGDVAVEFEFLPQIAAPEPPADGQDAETYTVGEFEFTKRTESGPDASQTETQKTDAAISAKGTVGDGSADLAKRTG